MHHSIDEVIAVTIFIGVLGLVFVYGIAGIGYGWNYLFGGDESEESKDILSESDGIRLYNCGTRNLILENTNDFPVWIESIKIYRTSTMPIAIDKLDKGGRMEVGKYVNNSYYVGFKIRHENGHDYGYLTEEKCNKKSVTK